MRRYALFLSIILFACDSQSEPNTALIFDTNSFQQWKLVRMTGSFDGSETTGSAMEWQETYTFKTDFTFVKSRVADTSTNSSSGVFEVTKENNETLLYLTYLEETPIAGSCFGKSQEVLNLMNGGQSLQSTWLACDGPGLFYERIE